MDGMRVDSVHEGPHPWRQLCQGTSNLRQLACIGRPRRQLRHPGVSCIGRGMLCTRGPPGRQTTVHGIHRHPQYPHMD